MKTLRVKKSVSRGQMRSNRRLLLCLCGTIVLAAAVLVVFLCMRTPEADLVPDAPQTTTAPVSDDDDSAPFSSEALKAAHEQNSDVVGWLTVAGCEIDDPVVQAEDNDRYLRRTVESEAYDVWGCYFLDYINRTDGYSLRDRVSIIYGHSLDDSAESERFSKLKRYKNAEFSAAHPTVSFSTLHKHRQWEIFAVCDVPITIDYIDPNPDDEKFSATVSYMLQNSYVDFGAEVGMQDRILLLSTCTADPAVRFVIAAKQIEER
ncbi:MAG: class B sortase [Oscillospiraceae bacterium]|nr:class B sortase [Oscillospiraceae bacterium]